MEKRINKKLCCLYLAVVFGICLAPLLATGIKENDSTKENRRLAEMPLIYNENAFNWNYLQELGTYFEEHFGFRQELVSADAKIRAGIFGVSAVDDVIVGKDGWLYYTATLDDFQHRNPVSDRMIFNMAHNVSLMQDYTEGLGKKFLFAIAPNKNSLYGENMPDRFKYQISGQSDSERLALWLEKENVNYVDLFALFRAQEEILYYKGDSHWNKKGAVLVYDRLLDACGKAHMEYVADRLQASEDHYGDLNTMLFPSGAVPEKDTVYAFGNEWNYMLGKSVEDRLVMTECGKGSGRLLMYRDSFGNSLVPLMAGEFSQAVFSSKVPYQMTDKMIYEPDIVILEKVERHLPTLGKAPPLMDAPEVKPKHKLTPVDSATTLGISKEGSYFKIEGTADSAYMDVDSRIFVEAGGAFYEAFCVSRKEGGSVSDYGYAAYLPAAMFDNEIADVKVVAETDGRDFILY